MKKGIIKKVVLLLFVMQIIGSLLFADYKLFDSAEIKNDKIYYKSAVYANLDNPNLPVLFILYKKDGGIEIKLEKIDYINCS